MAQSKSGIPNRDTFLTRNDISQTQFDESDLTFESLDAVFDHYITTLDDLEVTGKAIADKLQSVPSVHSVRMRIKDPEHLIAKIIRKSVEKAPLSIDVNNYREHITDLVGVRALHLFKGEWSTIDDFIRKSWDLEETAVAYVRDGDSATLREQLEAANCAVGNHEASYRSIHYLIGSAVTKQKCLVEIQVRTVFEEGWSEIDHAVRYPQNSSDDKLQQLLAIFSLFAGTANDLGSFIRDYSIEVTAREEKAMLLEAELRKTISKLKVAKTERTKLAEQLDSLRESLTTGPALNLQTSSLYEFSPNSVKLPSLNRYGSANSVQLEVQQVCRECGKMFTHNSAGIFHTGDVCHECYHKRTQIL